MDKAPICEFCWVRMSPVWAKQVPDKEMIEAFLTEEYGTFSGDCWFWCCECNDYKHLPQFNWVWHTQTKPVV